MDLEEIRLKELADLSDEEKGILREHKDDLTDDELKTFADALKEEDDDKGFSFKNQEDFDSKVEEKARAILKEEMDKLAKDDKDDDASDNKGADFDLFPKDYKASDWNEPFKKALPKLVEAVVTALKGDSVKRQQELDKINQDFDQEIEALRKDNGSAIPKKGTDEFTAFNRELASIGVKYGLHNMTQAFEIMQLKKAKDDGEGDPEKKKADLARKVGGRGGGTPPPKSNSYSRLGKSMDQLLAEKMEELGIKE